MRGSYGTGALLACLLLETSCVKYPPGDLNPVQSETRYRARNLNSPGLAEFARAQSGDAALPWPPAQLNAESLTYVAFFFSSELDVARAEVATKSAALIAARQRINPSISLEGGRNKTPDSISTYAFSSAFTIETAGKRGYRILEAEKLLEASRIAVWESAWKLRGRLRAALAGRYFATLRAESFEAELAIRAEAVAILEKRLALGEAANPELNAARAEQSAASLNLRGAQGDLAQTLAAVAAAAGVPVAAIEGIPLDLSSFANPEPPEILPLLKVQRAGLLHRADIRRMLAEYEATDAALRLEIANQYPNITLNPAYAFQEGFPSYMLGSAIESLPVFHHNQGAIAEREAARHLAETQFVALQAHVVADTESALLSFREAVEEWAAERELQDRRQTQREAAVRSSFQAGESDRLDVAQTRLQSVVARRSVVERSERAQAALGALEDTVQSPLAAGLPGPHPETNH